MSAPQELGGEEYHIGSLISTSAATSSNWGDNGLFFRHQWVEDDIAAMPSWEPYYPMFKDIVSFDNLKQAATKKVEGAIAGCPFAHLWQ